MKRAIGIAALVAAVISLMHSQDVTANVQGALVGPPTFTISASPPTLTIQPGQQGTSTITTAISGGFNSAISLSSSGLPFGVGVNFNPQTIPAPGAGSRP